jgi:hypothetical protein
MSKQLRFTQANDLSKLFGELLVAGALPPTVDGRSPCQGLGNDIYLTVPDDADEAAIAAVVAAHDPTPLPAPPGSEQRIADLEAQIAALMDQLKSGGTITEEQAANIISTRVSPVPMPVVRPMS